MGKLCDVVLNVGDAAVSLKGHDTGRIYVVIAELNNDFVLVADGRHRLVSNPKTKRRKHLCFIGKTDACDDVEIAKQTKVMEEAYAKRR